jgi:hypothetical protein
MPPRTLLIALIAAAALMLAQGASPQGQTARGSMPPPSASSYNAATSGSGASSRNDSQTQAAIVASQRLSQTDAAAKWPAVTPLPAGRRKVLIYDFDDTLKNEGNVVANDAAWAVHAGVANGYAIAIASAGCKTEFVKTFLKRRIAPDVFTDAFLNSTAFQLCQPFKTYSLTPIVNYYGLSDARRCAILIDNSKYNKPFADAVGVDFQFVDNGALDGKVGERGLSASDYFSAVAQLDKTCPGTNPPPGEAMIPVAAKVAV